MKASLRLAMVLRDYQVQAIQSVTSALERGVRRPAFVLATGGGKTVVFSKLIPQLPSIADSGNKVLVLAHTEELIKQAAVTILKLNPELKVDIDMRHLKPSMDADVVVGSVPTLVRVSRLQQYDPLQYKAIILDECHHAAASSWKKILKHFDADRPDSKIAVIGCTATMERSDGKSLGEVFDEIVFERSLLTMVENKELVDVKFSSLKADIDLDKVKTRSDDYEISSLSAVVNTSDTNNVVVLAYKRLRNEFGFKSTLMFCVDINHCRTLCEILQQQGVNAQYVTGDTVKRERQAIISDFKAGKIDVLCNVQVFTEGTDMPNIDSLFLVRPTKSRPLLVQMIGRGLRLHEGKTHCHVVDIAGTRGTGIQSVPSLFSLPPDYVVHGKTYRELEKEKEDYERHQIAYVEKLKLEITTIDGFMELEAKDSEAFKDSKVVNEIIRNNKMDWVRLEYDVWGYPMGEKFFLLQRQDDYFVLYLTGFTSVKNKIASNFKCGKFTTKTEIIGSTNLETVLAKAQVLARQSTSRFFKDGGVTPKQREFLESKLTPKIKQYYDITPELMDTLRHRLMALPKNEASKLIFAVKYSGSSLHVRWSLQRLVGPDKRTQRALRALDLKMIRPSWRPEADNTQLAA